MHTTSFVLIIICVTSFWYSKWLHQHGTMSPNAQQTNCVTRLPGAKIYRQKKPFTCNEVVCLLAWSCLSPNSWTVSCLPACLRVCLSELGQQATGHWTQSLSRWSECTHKEEQRGGRWVPWLWARVFHTGGLWTLGAAMQRLQMRGLAGKIKASVSS